MKIHKHNLRIIELINQGYVNDEISKAILKEFNIYMTPKQIDSKRKIEYQDRIEDKVTIERKSLCELVIEVLGAENKRPKTAKEIKALINRKNNTKYTRPEIRDILWKDLRSSISYDRSNFTYKLKNKFIKNISDAQITKKDHGNEYTTRSGEIKILLTYLKESDLISQFSEYMKRQLIKINTGNEKIDGIIRSVIKNNVITTAEENYLLQKMDYFGIDSEIITNVKLSLEKSKIPIDENIHLILDDGEIEGDELIDLKEKAAQLGIDFSIASERFWLIAGTYYFGKLRVKYNKLDNIVILWGIMNFIHKTQVNYKLMPSEHFNIFTSNNIQDVIDKGIIFYESVVSQRIDNSKLFELAGTEIIKLAYRSITINGITKLTTFDNINYDDLDFFLQILEEEKLRLGTPEVNLLVENVKFRIENQL